MRIELADRLTLGEVAHAVGKEAPQGRSEAAVRFLTTDSRLVLPGDLFVAIRGERTNGHAFLNEARARGAAAILSEEDAEGAIRVSSTRSALLELASYTLEKERPRVIGITGSVGKTGTKDAVAAVLSTAFSVHKTAKNLNNELGLAFSVLSRPKNTEVLVLELGTNHPGEIAPLSRAIHPDLAIITAIGSAHIGAFGSKEAILAEKSDILCGMEKGALVLNGDDPLLRSMEGVDRVRYVGIEKEADFFAKKIFSSRFGTSYTLKARKGEARIFLRGTGRPRLYASLFAIAVASEFSVPFHSAREALFRMQYAESRQTIEEAHGILLIDDAYNSSPESAIEALRLLSSIGRKRRFAVLGDMLELGAHSDSLHKEVGRYAATHSDFLYAFGAFGKALAEGAMEGGMDKDAIFVLRDADEVATLLPSVISDGDALLVKASHALGGQKIAEALRRRR